MTEEKNTVDLQWEDTWNPDDNQSNSWSSQDPTEPPVVDPNDLTIDPITNQVVEADLPFVTQVEEFNRKFNKPNNYKPIVPEKKDWQFVYDFVLEELEEYKEACEKGDIVGVLDALCDIAYVSLGNGTMLHGLKTKLWPAYIEVQLSNLSKSCSTPQEALDTVKHCEEKYGEDCHVEQVNDRYVVYRTRDRKVMKSINYFSPNLDQFFSEEEKLEAKNPSINRELTLESQFFSADNPQVQHKPKDLREDLSDIQQSDNNPILDNNGINSEEDYW